MSDFQMGPNAPLADAVSNAQPAQPANDPRQGEVAIPPKHSPDQDLSPANLLRMAESGVDLDGVLDQLQGGRNLDEVSFEQGQRAQPRKPDGRFEQRQPEQRTSDNRQPTDKAPEQPAPEGRIRLKDGREVTTEQLEHAIELANRAARIDRSFEERAQRLREAEERLASQERFAQEGLQLRDLAFNDFERFRQLTEATTGRRLPIPQPNRSPAPYGYEDADTRAAERVEEAATDATSRGEFYSREMARQDFQKWRQEERATEDATNAIKSFYSSIDDFANEAIRGIEEFDGVEEDTLRAIGGRIGKDIRLGQLVPPDLAKGIRGSTRDDVKKAVMFHAKELIMRERSRFDKHSAKRFEAASKVAQNTPAAVRNGATFLPGVTQRARDEAEVPTTIDGLIAQVTRIADEYEAGQGSALGG